jgi:anti-sigma B factor antagonist
MNDTITIKNEDRPGFHLISLTGSLSAKNILEVRSYLDHTLKKAYPKVALDLSEVNYLDSMGLGILINFNKRVGKSRGEFLVVNPSTVVSEIFEIADTEKYLKIRNIPAEKIDTLFS